MESTNQAKMSSPFKNPQLLAEKKKMKKKKIKITFFYFLGGVRTPILHSMFGNRRGIYKSNDFSLPLEQGFLTGDLYS